jgi:hypothetical protein
MIISILIKISEEFYKIHSEEQVKNFKLIDFMKFRNSLKSTFTNIIIPLPLIIFATKIRFHKIYAKIRKTTPERDPREIPHWARNVTRTANLASGKTQFPTLHPDFPGEDDSLITKRETGMSGIDLLNNLSDEKDFVGIKKEIEKAKKNKNMPDLVKQIEKIGISVTADELSKMSSLNKPKKLSQDEIENAKKLFTKLSQNNFDLKEQYLKAKEIKQGAQYLTKKINGDKKMVQNIGSVQDTEIKNIITLIKNREL